jgi:hypothetical protein
MPPPRLRLKSETYRRWSCLWPALNETYLNSASTPDRNVAVSGRLPLGRALERRTDPLRVVAVEVNVRCLPSPRLPRCCFVRSGSRVIVHTPVYRGSKASAGAIDVLGYSTWGIVVCECEGRAPKAPGSP